MQSVLTQASGQWGVMAQNYPLIMVQLWPPTNRSGWVAATAAPSVVSPAPGVIVVLPLVETGGLFETPWPNVFDGVTWEGFRKLGPVPGGRDTGEREQPGQPALVSWGPGRAHTFLLGTDNALWTASWDGHGWSDYSQLGPEEIVGQPSAVCWGPNRIDVFVQRPDRTIWTKAWNGIAWSAYSQLSSEVVASPPVAVSWGRDRIDLFAQGTDDAVWTNFWNGSTWSDWTQLGSETVAARPFAVCSGANRIDLFVQRPDKTTWTKVWDGSAWSGYRQISTQPVASAPIAASREADRIDLFVQGTDKAVWTQSWNGTSWSALKQLGGSPVVSTPTAVSNSANQISLFVPGANNLLMTKALSGTSWSEYTPLGPEPFGIPASESPAFFGPLRGISYSIMDTTYGGSSTSDTGSYSLEFFFPAIEPRGGGGLNSDVVAFVDAVAAAVNAATDTFLLGYVSLRFTGLTRATLGMQHWPETCCVEISVLQGVQNELELMSSLLSLAYQHGGLPHWGQMIDQGVSVPSGGAALHPGYAAWRDVYAKMSSNFTIRTFENALSVRWNLTTPPPPPELSATCQPPRVKLGTPQTFEITARQAGSSKIVSATVLADGVRIGTTGTQITHTFVRHIRVTPALAETALPRGNGPGNTIETDPIVTVEAPGYRSAEVDMGFTAV